jgi:murein DD-endopeptidase MepM/ murein hydrolase activator NlpD
MLLFNYVDKASMKPIIMDQHVERRLNRDRFLFRKAGASTAHKPYKYIDGIKQHPSRIKRRYKKKTGFGSFFKTFSAGGKAGPGNKGFNTAAFSRLFDFGGPRIRRVSPETETRAVPKQVKRSKRRKSLQFSLAPIFMLGGIAIFSVLTLNWRNPQAAALASTADFEVQANMAFYAGIEPLSARRSEGESESIPLDLTDSFRWESYTVRSGDSVSKIAAAYSVSMDAIIASNNITNARRLREGASLRIPNMDGIPYTVRKGDSLSGISATMDVPLEVILDANNIESEIINTGMTLFIPGARMRGEDLRQALGDLFIYPIRGRLTSPFGWRSDPISGNRRFHAAIDLAAPTGTPIKAAMDGRVSTVGYNSVYGKYIIISHGNGFQTWYAHMSVTSVAQGASVRQGARIGEVGSTGYSTGPHLHFAVYKNGKPVNPLEVLH